jgi:hypothetical protein
MSSAMIFHSFGIAAGVNLPRYSPRALFDYVSHFRTHRYGQSLPFGEFSSRIQYDCLYPSGLVPLALCRRHWCRMSQSSAPHIIISVMAFPLAARQFALKIFCTATP